MLGCLLAKSISRNVVLILKHVYSLMAIFWCFQGVKKCQIANKWIIFFGFGLESTLRTFVAIIHEIYQIEKFFFLGQSCFVLVVVIFVRSKIKQILQVINWIFQISPFCVVFIVKFEQVNFEVKNDQSNGQCQYVIKSIFHFF